MQDEYWCSYQESGDIQQDGRTPAGEARRAFGPWCIAKEIQAEGSIGQVNDLALSRERTGMAVSTSVISCQSGLPWRGKDDVLSRCPRAGGGLVREILLGFLMRERCKWGDGNR